MGRVGEKLRDSRLSKGLTLEEVAEVTKIRSTYLAAIEAGEYGKLPGEVFLKGFIAQYAQAMDEDPEPYLELYRQERAEAGTGREPGGEEEARPRLDPERRRFLRRLIIGVVGFLLLIGLVLVALGRRGRREPPSGPAAVVTVRATAAPVATPRPRVAEPTATQGEAAVTPAGVPAGRASPPPGTSLLHQLPKEVVALEPPPAPPPGARALRFEAEEPAWIRVRADGQEVAAQLLEPDEPLVVGYRRSIEVHCGNCGSIEAFDGERSLGRLGDGAGSGDWRHPRSAP
jgi:cytoskeletal protein RodZ